MFSQLFFFNIVFFIKSKCHFILVIIIFIVDTDSTVGTYDADPDPPHCLIPLEMLKETFILENFLKVRCRTINIILKKYTLCLTKYW